MKAAIIDYGMGNLGSVNRALTALGAQVCFASQPEHLATVDRIVLPGVGNFADGMMRLSNMGLDEAIKYEVQHYGKPLLGICLGMQLLADFGSEGGETQGLGLIPGNVARLDSFGCGLRIPHVGWNAVMWAQNQPKLFLDIPCGTDFYFVHGYALRATVPAHVLAHTDYDVPLVAAVSNGNIYGVQFHPEKSSKAGFRLLKNFLETEPC